MYHTWEWEVGNPLRPISPDSPNYKYLIIIWALSTLILSNYFVNDMQAVLVSNKEKRIENFQQLVEREDVTTMAIQRSYSYGFIINVSSKNAWKINLSEQILV